MHVQRGKSVDELTATAVGYEIVAVDALLLFGHEGTGLSSEARDAASLVCSNAQYGSTRSIDAGVLQASRCTPGSGSTPGR